MTGLGSCGWPVWQIDEFTTCFRSDYLQILFPFIALCISLAYLLLQGVLSKVSHGLEADQEQAPYQHNHTALPSEEVHEWEHAEDEEVLVSKSHGAGGRIMLAKSAAIGSITQADTPWGQHLTPVVEELAVLGLVAVNVAPFVSDTNDGYRPIAALTGIVAGLYLLVLVTLRRASEHAGLRSLRLWNHTAALYGVQWLIALILLHSVIVSPGSQLHQTLTIVRFGLTTLLFGLAITSRVGNKTVLLEWEDEIEPSREPLASVLSSLTFWWVDSLVWKGYKAPLELSAVWNLLPLDRAASILADYRRLRKTTTLSWHLGKFLGRLLAVQAFWGLISGVLTFAPTFMLKAILEYLEQPGDTPISVIWLCVILLPVFDLIRSVADGQALWIGRKIGIRVRAVIIGEVFAKALRVKAASGVESTPSNVGDTKEALPSKDSKLNKLKRWIGLSKDDAKVINPAQGEVTGEAVVVENDPFKTLATDEKAKSGMILNLISIDSFKASEVSSHLHLVLSSAPSQLIVCIFLLYKIMGFSAIPGVIITIILLPVNIWLAEGFLAAQKTIMAATDNRIQITNEVFQNIRIIKYFAWELRFSNIVDEKRKEELKAIRTRCLVWAGAVALWNTFPILVTFFSFLVYIKVEGKPLYPSVAFTSISLFMLLRVPLDVLGYMNAHMQAAAVSVQRVEDFLRQEDTEKYQQLGEDNVDEHGKKVIGFRNATFTWGNKSSAPGSTAFQLRDLNCDFKIGKVNIIAGPTGSGKTSTLMALLGELTLLEGRVYLPGGRSRDDVFVDPSTGLAETCAYVAQTAWLINSDIRENILFSAPYNATRYKQVISACGLERDLQILDKGDKTPVGDKGVTLSGGQKQRISLARAVYSNSRHLLLDDCLSAVDSHTAQWIVTNCLKGPLMKNRTCILVTHNVLLCVPWSDYVVILDNGKVVKQGSPLEVIASGALGKDIQTRPQMGDYPGVSQNLFHAPFSVGGEGGHTLLESSNGTLGSIAQDMMVDADKKDSAMGEKKATGAIKWSVMRLYFGAMGSWWFWIFTALCFGGQQFSTVAWNLWIREWANQYPTGTEPSAATFQFSQSSQMPVSLSPAYSIPTFTSAHAQRFFSAAQYSTAEAPDEVNVNYYLAVLALIGISTGALTFARDMCVFLGSLSASWKLHNQLLNVVLKARFRFFDSTPLGQIINRFSKDFETIDHEYAPVVIGVIGCSLSILVSVVIIGAITPEFLIAGIFISAGYLLVSMVFLRVSRSLKRLEAVYRSPILQQFSEVLAGVTTIRAYGDELRFIYTNLANVDTQARPFQYLWATNRWFGFRIDVLSNFVAVSVGVFLVLNVGRVDAGSAGIALSYAVSFSNNILWLVRLYGQSEQNMNSVERINEYLEVDQEPSGGRDCPPPDWPAQGSVEFVGYSTQYREDLDPVLRDITLRINPFEKVGIVGRTGAGKSSLALAIFRGLEARTGKILIDGVDIGQIDLKILREAITIVPQDPTLFAGNIRTNLDPFGLYTDEQLFSVLRRVQLIMPEESPATPVTATAIRQMLLPSTSSDRTAAPTSASVNKNVFLDLSSPVAELGTNLSQGQRQLLCLARAILKDPRVLIMDEATASIDYATDAKIQAVIRELSSTIITIAHRLATIADYDKVLVLDHGSVVEYGHPWELLEKPGGHFRSMCESSGDMRGLMETAKAAFEAKGLLNDA